MNVFTDAELLAQCRADSEAFGALYDRHANAVHGYLARRAGTRHVEDLLSEVFLRALESRRRVRPHDSGSALPWLYGIARNVLLKNRVPTLRVLSDDTVDAFDWGRVDERLDAAAISDVLRVALNGLSATEREVLLLVSWEQLSVAEAANVLGIRPGAARTRLHRARAHAAAVLAAAPSTFQTQEM